MKHTASTPLYLFIRHCLPGRRARGAAVVFLLSLFFSLTAVSTVLGVPSIVTTKADILIVDNDADNVADPGDTIRYTIFVTNTGSTNAGNAGFNDMIDPNTTLVAGSVRTTPIARHDSYSSLGNIGITVPAFSGVLVNDNDPDGTTPTLTISGIGVCADTTAPFDCLSFNGGDVSLAADGSFSYTPPPGFEGTDQFTYAIQDSDGNIDPASVFIVVSGMVWFIDNTAAPGDGRLNSPFNSISAFNSGAADAAGETIFLHSGSGNYISGLTLLNSQLLVGQGATASLASIAGLTLPPHSNALPSTGGTRPVMTTTSGNGVTLAQNNLVRGLNVGNTAAAGISDNASTVGTLIVSEVAITGTGEGFEADNGGTLAVTLDSLNANSGARGLSLVSTGGSFTVTGTGSANSGGTLSGHSAEAVYLNGVTNVTLTDMVINQASTASTQGIDATNVTGLTLLRTTITAGSSSSYAMLGSGITNMTATSTVFDGGGGNVPNIDGVRITNLLGSNTFTDSTFRNGKDINLLIENNTNSGGQDLVTISGGTLSNSAGGDHLQVDANGTANLKLVVNASGAGNTTFSGTGQDGIQLESQGSATLQAIITGSTFNSTLGSTVNMAAAGSGNLIARVHNLTGLTSSGTNVINVIGFDTSTIEATIENNTITSGTAGNGIRVIQEGNGTITADIGGNVISGITQGSGILVQGRAGTGGNGLINATIDNNNVTTTTALSLDGIEVTSGSSAGGDTNTICLNMFSNTSSSAAFDGYFLRQRTGSTFRLQDFPSGTAANWVTNTKSNVGSVFTTGTFTNAPSACATPTVPTASLLTGPTVADAAPGDGHAVLQMTPSERASAHGWAVRAMPVVEQRSDKAAALAKPALSGETVNLSLGTLDPGQIVIITFDVTIDSPISATQVCNQGLFTGNNFADVLTDDPNVGGATDPTCTPLDQPSVDLAITKDDGSVTAVPGDTIPYVLTYQNNGDADALGTTISDTVPTGTTFNAGASTAGWSCADGAPAGTACTINVGTVTAGSAASAVTFAVTVDNPLAGGIAVINNSATISDDGSSGPDANTADNTDSDSTPVTAQPDLQLSKDDGGVSVNPGDTIVYTLDYTNVGNQLATNVTLTETVPANTTFNLASSTAGWTCPNGAPAGSACTINAGSLNGGGATGGATFAVTVDAGAPPSVTEISNTAGVLDDGTNGADPTPNDNAANDTTPVVPPNQPPTIENGDLSLDNAVIDENDTVILSGSFTDPDSGDSHTVTIDWGDGSSDTVLNLSGDRGFNTTHQYLDDNPTGTSSDDYTIAVTVEDGNGESDSASATVTVNNVAPQLGSIVAPADPVNINNQPIVVTAVFTDPGTLDMHTAVWDWGDGSSDTVSASGGSVSGSHTYADAGVYRITLTLTDDDTGSDTAIYEFVVVYDPAGGFVTGGGWIDSPSGACPDFCNNATGRANFGFVAKYKKGKQTPEGNTQFQFQSGNLNFHSNSYDWLVINQGSSRAQFKGSGLINGSAAPTGDEYKFMIWAVDGGKGGSNDTFRIKIWYEDGGEVVVYDNGMEQLISGGNITVHKGK